MQQSGSVHQELIRYPEERCCPLPVTEDLKKMIQRWWGHLRKGWRARFLPTSLIMYSSLLCQMKELAGTRAYSRMRLKSKAGGVAGCRCACAKALKVKMGSRNVETERERRRRTLGGQRSSSVLCSFLLLGIWTPSMCEECNLKCSLWKQKKVLSVLTCLGQSVPLLLHYNHVL